MEPSKKEEELYKASLQAFFQNELEHDKTVLGLSTAALGCYIAIFQSDKVISEVIFITSIIIIFVFAIHKALTMTQLSLNGMYLI